jgi:hypothetical protein
MLPFVPENGFSTFVLMTDGPREIKLWDGEVGQERLQANLPFRLPERLRLGRVAVRRPIEGVLLGPQHPLYPVVMGLEVDPREGPVLVAAALEVFLDGTTPHPCVTTRWRR